MVFSESYGLGLRKIGVNLYASGECTMLHGPLVLIPEPLNLRILRLYLLGMAQLDGTTIGR